MAFNLMAGAVSATILKSRGVPNDKVVAGAAVSALTPGVLGLVIPLVLARQFGNAPSTGGGSTTSGNTVDLTQVPDVAGDSREEATRQVKDAGLRARVTPAKIHEPESPPVEVEQTVLAQEPAAGTFREVGSEVRLYVGEPKPPTTEPGGAPKSSGPDPVGDTKQTAAESSGRRKPPTSE